MSTRQDGPALAGGQDTSTNTIRPVPIDHATGALLVTGSGGSGGSVTQGTVPWVVNSGGLGVASYDYASLAQASLTDVWTFRTGGSGGTVVNTVTITYTDSTKGTISSVAKT